ncbi:hypothetical protein AQUCO_02100138v1 [Aquilegia coerulea]|uniref:Ornithine aminotransferase n=1 Tax=Aquilegia coerulea TaxID=218851 RepID=A0A2G5DF11_AQUCA|nr:hypothetical protein AQUCO_02100138v1 [Aquilegia coerulea]
MGSSNLMLNSSISSIIDHSSLFNKINKGRFNNHGYWRISASINVETVGTKLGLTKSEEIMAAEAKVIVGTYARVPIVLASGKGCKLYDVEGREYLDMTSGIAVNALGHADSDWVNAVKEQADVLAHVSNVYYSREQLQVIHGSD